MISDQVGLEVGQTAVRKIILSQEDFDRFAALSGDDNPIHVDPVFSAKSHFGRTVCHGMLLYGAISRELGAQLPGPGVVQLEQELMFPTPTFTGEEMTVRLEVLEVRWADGSIKLDTTISHPDGRIACQGQTTVAMDVRHLGAGRSQRSIVETSETAEFKGLQIGQKALATRVFSEEDLVEYANLTGDNNPLFADAAYAQEAGLKTQMIPGSLLGGLFSYLLGTKLPGRGTNWLKQQLSFHRPAYPGEAITAEVEVKRLRPEKELVNLTTRCNQPSGETVCTGEALVLIRDLE